MSWTSGPTPGDESTGRDLSDPDYSGSSSSPLSSPRDVPAPDVMTSSDSSTKTTHCSSDSRSSGSCWTSTQGVGFSDEAGTQLASPSRDERKGLVPEVSLDGECGLVDLRHKLSDLARV